MHDIRKINVKTGSLLIWPDLGFHINKLLQSIMVVDFKGLQLAEIKGPMNIKLFHEHADQAVPHRAIFPFSAVRIDRILEDLRVKICAWNFFDLLLEGFVQLRLFMSTPLGADVVAVSATFYKSVVPDRTL